MLGKVHTIKPKVIKPKVIYSPQIKKEKSEEKVSFKERLMEMMETFFLILFSIVFLILTVAVAYKSLVYFKMKTEKKLLSIEKMQLEKELNRLTSREVILEKAKHLGLKPPQEKDFIILK